MVIYNGCLTKNLQEKDRLKFLRFGENDKKKKPTSIVYRLAILVIKLFYLSTHAPLIGNMAY
jgi:hypothetical protein